MKIQKAVRDETLHILEGTTILCVIMIAAFAVAGRFDSTVVFGALLGGGYAVLNFFLLGLTVQRATSMDDEKRARAMMQFSYSMRMLLTMGVAVLGFALPYFHWVAVICPLIFPRITIFFMSLKNFKGKEES